MKRLDRYLLLEALPALGFGVLVYSALVIVSVTLPRLQWIVGVPLPELASWLALQFPAAFVQTLPVALVLAVLLAFGQLAANNELSAARAGGVSVLRTTRAFIFLGTVLTVLALALNQYVLPNSNARVGSLYWQLTGEEGSGLLRLVKQNVPLGDYTLYFGEAGADNVLRDVRLESWQAKTLTVVFADEARFVEEGLELTQYQLDTLDIGVLQDLDLSAATTKEDFEALAGQLVRRHSSPSEPGQTLTLNVSETLDELITNYSQGGFEDSRSLSELWADTRADLNPKERRSAHTLFHRKLAEPFANLTLLLVAVPLSLLYASRRSVAFGLSLGITVAWYLLFTFGQLYAQAGQVPPWLGVWGANIVLAVVGLGLLVRLRWR